MSVKHVKEYYLKVANDYHMMNKTLQELEKTVSDKTASVSMQNIDIIRQQVSQLKENYLRISYIMFLLNMPNKKDKQKKYTKQEQKRISQIPDEHKFSGVLDENKKILSYLTNIGKN